MRKSILTIFCFTLFNHSVLASKWNSPECLIKSKEAISYESNNRSLVSKLVIGVSAAAVVVTGLTYTGLPDHRFMGESMGGPGVSWGDSPTLDTTFVSSSALLVGGSTGESKTSTTTPPLSLLKCPLKLSTASKGPSFLA